MGGLRLSNLVAVLLLAGACDDPYAAEVGAQTSDAAPTTSSADDGTTAADAGTSGDAGSTGGAEDPSTGADTTGATAGSTTGAGEGSTGWPAASMDGGDEPASSTGGDEGPTCTELECPVSDLAGCVGDCNPCDPWTISWAPVPGVSTYLIRAKTIHPYNDGPMLPGDPPVDPDPMADTFVLQDSVFRVTADGAPSTYQWGEVDGRIAIPCSYITGGCGTYGVAEVEVVGCVGGLPEFPLSSTCGGAPVGGVASMLPLNGIPTGVCDADTTSTG